MNEDLVDRWRLRSVAAASYLSFLFLLVLADRMGLVGVLVRVIALSPAALLFMSASAALTLPAVICLTWGFEIPGNILAGVFGALGGVGLFAAPGVSLALGLGWWGLPAMFDAVIAVLVAKATLDERRWDRHLLSTESILVVVLSLSALCPLLGVFLGA